MIDRYSLFLLLLCYINGRVKNVIYSDWGVKEFEA